MGIWEWISQNWFNLFSAITVIAGLWFTAFSIRADIKTRRIANLLTITANHREVWNKIFINPELKRVLNPAADPVKHPINEEEEMFVNMVIQHINSVYYALSDQLVIQYEGLRRDVSDFFSLPIPKTVWKKSKKFQNDDFVKFVECALK
jgi:hypothetical protein